MEIDAQAMKHARWRIAGSWTWTRLDPSSMSWSSHIRHNSWVAETRSWRLGMFNSISWRMPQEGNPGS